MSKYFWHSTLMNTVSRMVVKLDNYLWRKRAHTPKTSATYAHLTGKIKTLLSNRNINNA